MEQNRCEICARTKDFVSAKPRELRPLVPQSVAELAIVANYLPRRSKRRRYLYRRLISLTACRDE